MRDLLNKLESYLQQVSLNSPSRSSEDERMHVQDLSMQQTMKLRMVHSKWQKLIA